METIPFNILTFPLWWYSTGLKLTMQWAGKSFNFTLRKSGLKIFLRHFGDTLYGYHSKADAILSFFLRLVLLVFKVCAIFFKMAFLALSLILYIAALPLVIALIVYTLIPF